MPVNEKNPVGRGPATKAFTEALRDINRFLTRRLLAGHRKYFDKLDARAVYDKYKGKCAYCGLPLVCHGKKTDSLRFMLHRPLQAGGKVERSNLIPVCLMCQQDHGPPPKVQSRRIEGFNTIPDIIQRLVYACMAEDEETIPLLKRELNNALADLTVTLQYVVSPDQAGESYEPLVEGSNTVADIIESRARSCCEGCNWTADKEYTHHPDCVHHDLSRGLSNAFKAIRITRGHRILREI